MAEGRYSLSMMMTSPRPKNLGSILAFGDGLVNESRPTPLVLNLHGHSDDMARHLEVSRMEPKADMEGFVTVAPVGTLDDGDNYLGYPVEHWNVNDTPGEADDVAFIEQLLDQLETDVCVDLDRVYKGAGMSARIACTIPGRIAAVAAVTAFYHGPSNCDESRTPAVQFHGDADQVAPFVWASANVGLWATDAGCSGEPIITTVSPEVYLRSFPDCANGIEVEQYVVEGGGHRWPGSPLPADLEPWADVIGYGTMDIDATAVAWEFFENHPMS